MALYNPRFPHTLVLLRPVVDSYGDPVYDEEGDPTYQAVSIERVVYEDEECYNPQYNAFGELVTEMVEELPFGYRTSTGGLKESGEVIVADQKIGLPKIITKINTGDLIRLTDDVRTYYGKVMKAMSYNWGSNIWFNDVKN